MAEAEVLDYNINRYGICGVKIRQLNSDYIFGMSIDKIFLTKNVSTVSIIAILTTTLICFAVMGERKVSKNERDFI